MPGSRAGFIGFCALALVHFCRLERVLSFLLLVSIPQRHETPLHFWCEIKRSGVRASYSGDQRGPLVSPRAYFFSPSTGPCYEKAPVHIHSGQNVLPCRDPWNHVKCQQGLAKGCSGVTRVWSVSIPSLEWEGEIPHMTPVVVKQWPRNCSCHQIIFKVKV